MAKKTITLPNYLKERYEKAKLEGIARHYAKNAPQLVQADHSDEITGNEHGKYQGEIYFFMPERSVSFLFEFDPGSDVWRTTHDWND